MKVNVVRICDLIFYETIVAMHCSKMEMVRNVPQQKYSELTNGHNIESTFIESNGRLGNFQLEIDYFCWITFAYVAIYVT